jgi:periplasmic protein TonB
MANHAAGLPKLGPVAESAAGDAPAGPLLSPSHDFLGIGPVGWSGAAIVLVVIALATTPFGVREAPPETKPLLVGLTLETRPAPPAPEPPPTPSADLPAAPPEPLASPMPSAEPSPEAATPADEEPYTLPAPSEVATAPPPTAAAPPEALQRPPPPKPRAPPAPRHRAPTTATKVPPAAPTQEAALPIVPPRPISGMPDNAVADHAAQADPHHVEGEVILRVEVSATGNLISVAIAQSSGNDVLDQAALLVVRHWRFSPATRGGEPVAGTAEVPIWSRLED